MKNKFVINNLDEFVEGVRKVVFYSFGKNEEPTENDLENIIVELGPEEQKEMDHVLGHQESKMIVTSLVKTQTNKITKENRYVLDDIIFAEIIESLNARMVSNILVQLTKKGLVESAYDEKLDDFIFWVKDDNDTEHNNQEPETE